jgi:hypothetical protein
MFDILKFEILSFRTNEILKIWSVEHLVCRTFDFSKFWYFVQIRTTDGRNFGVRKIGFQKNNVAPFVIDWSFLTSDENNFCSKNLQGY